MAYILGNTITAYCTFEALDLTALPRIVRALANPTTVVVTVTSPTGVITTPAAVNVRAGVYYALFEADEVGRWTVRFAGSGAADAVNEQQFLVSA